MIIARKLSNLLNQKYGNNVKKLELEWYTSEKKLNNTGQRNKYFNQANETKVTRVYLFNYYYIACTRTLEQSYNHS